MYSRVFSQAIKPSKGLLKRSQPLFVPSFMSSVYKVQKSNREKQIVEGYLGRFELCHLTSDISARTIDLIRTYSNTHGLLLADALIAATCLEGNLTLVTYNIVDFQFVQGLKYLKPSV